MTFNRRTGNRRPGRNSQRIVGQATGNYFAFPPVTANLVAYFDPDYSPGIVLSGSDVSSLTSRVTSIAQTVLGASGSRPTLTTYTETTRNALNFASASQQSLRGASSPLADALDGLQPYTLYSALEFPTTFNANTIFSMAALGAGQGYALNATVTSGNPLRDQYARNQNGAGVTNNFSTPQAYPVTGTVLASMFDGVGVVDTLNNVVVLSGSNTRDIGTLNQVAFGVANLGAGAFTSYMNGKMGRTLIYNVAHDAPTRQLITNWLNAYYRVNSVEQSFRDLFTSGSTWIDADRTNDISGLVTDFIDYTDPTHLFTQATPANQVSSSLATGIFNGAKTVQFVSGTSTNYVSNRAAGQWTHLSNGSGVDVFMVFAPSEDNGNSQYLLSTYTSGVNSGFTMLQPAAATTWRCNILSSVAGASVVDCDNVTSLMPFIPTYQEFSYKEGIATPEMVSYSKYNVADTGDSTIAPSATAPPASLNLGRRANASTYSSMKFAALYIFPYVLSSTQRAAVQARITQKYGMGLFQNVLGLSQGRPVFTADKYVEDPLHPGFVLRFVDWNDPTHYLEQTDTTKQVAIPAADAGFGNARVVTFTGVEWYRSNRTAAAWSFMVDGTGMEFFHVMTETIAGTHVIHSTGNGAGSNNDVFYIAGASVAFELYANPTQVFSRTLGVPTLGVPTYFNGFYLEGASPETSLMIKNGASSTGTSVIVPPATPTATMTLGANSAGSQQAVMKWRASTFMPKLTAGGITTVQSWIQSDTGITP